MKRLTWVLLGIGALIVGVSLTLLLRGTEITAGLWLDGVPDPHSQDVHLYVFGSCERDKPEVIRSVQVEESPDDVIVTMTIRAPIGHRSCGSYEGTPFVIHLESPVASRTVSQRLSKTSIMEIQLDPFADHAG